MTDVPVAEPMNMSQLGAAIATGLKETGYKHDPGGSPITSGYSHGPGGNFSVPGVDPSVFHTVLGNKGILGMMPVTPAISTNPTYQVLTGVTADVGTEKEEVCDDAPTGGLAKSCVLTSVFGRYERQTQQIEINRLGQVNDRADPMDLSLVGSPIAQSGPFANGPGDPSIPGDMLRNETSRKFWELGVSLHRLISQQIWQGNPSNNAAGGGYKEVTGLDVLVNTGHTDAETGDACPSVDSQVRNFGYSRLEDNGSDLVSMFSNIYHILRELAVRTGVDPVNWVIAMRPTLFWVLTEIWPCAYLTYRCVVNAASGERINIDGSEQTRMRDELRAGMYLLIDGVRVPVVLDDGIPEASNTTNANVASGNFASSIYFLPMSVLGGRSSLFMEHFDYGNPSITSAIGALGGDPYKVEGPWITTSKFRNWCVQWQTKTEPRIVLRTPWLAGRIDAVQYGTIQHEREPFPEDPYFVDGGLTSRAGPSLYDGIWKT